MRGRPPRISGEDTINVPIPPVLVANNIVEGGEVKTQNPNLGNAQSVKFGLSKGFETVPIELSVTVEKGLDGGNKRYEGHFVAAWLF